MRIPPVLLSVALLAGALTAQLPRGHAVVARCWNPARPGVLGGLRVFDPLCGGFRDVTGLPPDLTGSADSPVPTHGVGANSVLVRDRDGLLFISPIVRDGRPLAIHALTLDGAAATVQTTYPIGAPIHGAHVDQMAWLPDGDLLFTFRGAMAGFPAQGIAALELSTGAVTQIPFAPIPTGWVNALAVDSSGPTAYVGMFGDGAGIALRRSVPARCAGSPGPRLNCGRARRPPPGGAPVCPRRGRHPPAGHVRDPIGPSGGGKRALRPPPAGRGTRSSATCPPRAAARVSEELRNTGARAALLVVNRL